MKLNLGCGSDIRAGYENHDKDSIDLEGLLPFYAGTVDEIVLQNVIEHIRNHRQLLKECFRVLSPGGELHLSTANYTSVGHRLALFFGKDYFLRDYNHLRFFSLKMIMEEVRAAKFEIVAVRGQSQTLSWLPARWAGNILVVCKKRE
jgi:2-polyprenyl-6-hydroxyphenyl methylase/3-demethylubiquinone-9 3-methyltransferase